MCPDPKPGSLHKTYGLCFKPHFVSVAPVCAASRAVACSKVWGGGTSLEILCSPNESVGAVVERMVAV